MLSLKDLVEFAMAEDQPYEEFLSHSTKLSRSLEEALSESGHFSRVRTFVMGIARSECGAS